MKLINIVKYIEQDTIEGYVEKEEDFDLWLLNHNKKRKEQGELEENKSEFKLLKIVKL